MSTTYITCPANPKKTLGIKLSYLVMIIKNLKKYFTFEVTVLDDKNVHRRFRASNYQSTTRVKPFICTMPMRLDDGWNQIQFNLLDFTRRAYGTNYIETLRVQIHANCRIRRIYFADRLYSEAELPAEFKLFLPVGKSQGAGAQAGTKTQSQHAALAQSAAAQGQQQSTASDRQQQQPAPPPEQQGEMEDGDIQMHEGEDATGDQDMQQQEGEAEQGGEEAAPTDQEDTGEQNDGGAEGEQEAPDQGEGGGQEDNQEDVDAEGGEEGNDDEGVGGEANEEGDEAGGNEDGEAEEEEA